MKNFLMAIAAAGSLVLGAGSASALVLGLGSASDNGVIGTSAVFNGGGVTVTATPRAGELTQNSGGLGVQLGDPSDPDALDTDTADEMIDFVFSELVSISSIQFGAFGPGGGDLYRIYSGGTAFSDVVVLAGNTGGANFDPDLVTDFLRIRALGGEFRVSSISFEAVNAASVPLPAGLPLLAGALGLLGIARRRKA